MPTSEKSGDKSKTSFYPRLTSFLPVKLNFNWQPVSASFLKKIPVILTVTNDFLLSKNKVTGSVVPRDAGNSQMQCHLQPQHPSQRTTAAMDSRRAQNHSQSSVHWKDQCHSEPALLCPIYCALFRTEWMKKPAFWSNGIIAFLNSAMDMNIEKSNQFSEAVIRTQKHDEGVQQHLSEPAFYLFHRFKQTRASSKRFIQESEQIDESALQVKKRRQRKKQRTDDSVGVAKSSSNTTNNSITESMTQDQIQQYNEEQKTEIWGQGKTNKFWEKDQMLARLMIAGLNTYAPETKKK